MAAQPHFLMFPYMAQGHMIPMVSFSRLLARRGVTITIVTTPQNAARFQAAVDRDLNSGLHIRFAILEFPSKAAGLPEGIGNQDQLPPSVSDLEFTTAVQFLQQPAEQLFETLNPRPNCIIFDQIMPFAMNIARKFNVPGICFYSSNCFSSVVMYQAYSLKHTTGSEDERLVVPGLPDRIELCRRHTLSLSAPRPSSDLPMQIYRAERAAFGTIVNTFEEMEPEYVKAYAKQRNRVWCVGPLSLYKTDAMDVAQRGKKAAVDENVCLKWLDSQKPSSVLYITFGSLFIPNPSQLIELAMGLASSGRPFIWAIKEGDDSDEFRKWVLQSQYEKKVEGRGFLIWGWAPQVLILSHAAIGGFLSHCGANSVVEGVSMGVPLITWPLMYEQFMTERLVVDVLRVAVSVGAKFQLDSGFGSVVAQDVKVAIDELMEEGEEAKERRRRVKDLAEMAKRAVAENGFSHLAISRLINDIMEQQAALV